METLLNTWLITPIIAVVIGLFKTEIGNILRAYRIFKNKIFPPGSNVQLFNEAKGAWGYKVTIEKYIFSLDSNIRGVYIRYWDGGMEKISILQWASWRKRPVVERKRKKTSNIKTAKAA